MDHSFWSYSFGAINKLSCPHFKAYICDNVNIIYRYIFRTFPLWSVVSPRIWESLSHRSYQNPDLNWLVVWNMTLIFPYIGNSNPN